MSRDVAVVGGGVVGLCVAEALARSGVGVTLLEASRCGAAASAGNAGWVTPGLSSPTPAPGTVAKGLRWMLSPRGPLRVRPVPRPSFGRWIYDFWRSSSPRRYAAGIEATMGLSRRALADFDELAERLPHFEAHRSGVLFVSHSEAALAAAVKTLLTLRAHGYEGRVEGLDRAGALAMEPALSADVAGAVLAADERHLRPEQFNAALLVRLREQGVEVREGTSVAALTPAAGGWTLTLPGGTLDATRVVLAGGAATPRLLRTLGVRLPMSVAKGYSMTRSTPGPVPRRPVYLLDAKVAVSPFDGGALRLAGILELGASDTKARRRPIAGIKRAVGRSFRDWDEGGSWETWAGLRPVAPDGLPVLGPVPGHAGLHLATGHAMLGVTLAPTTAALLAPAVLGGAAPAALAPFSVARF